MTEWLVAPEHATVVWVAGRPTGYAAGDNERIWKAAVAEALAGTSVAAPARVGVEVDFRLQPDQVRHLAPDLDNLVKSTVDAMAQCIGLRPIKGPDQADDERIDILVARKRVETDAVKAGAFIAVWSWD
jgi:Holliday junction resolvase RusA-like endonuclease